MHFKVIACEVFHREICYCAAQSVNTFDLDFLTQGYHDNSDICREKLQTDIDSVEEGKYAAILLFYALCNNGTVDLTSRHTPIVIPRAHDCITLFMGSKERYKEYFMEHPGTYYYTSGWLEYPERGGERVEMMQGSALGKQMKYEELVEQYGEDNAKYLIEEMEGWKENYSSAALIEFGFAKHLKLEQRVKDICDEHGWQMKILKGNLQLIQNCLDGKWDDNDFLLVPPGRKIAATHDDRIIELA